MVDDDLNELIGTIAAIRQHLEPQPDEAYTAEEIHAMWNEWPAFPYSVDKTRQALYVLRAAGCVRQLEIGADVEWEWLNNRVA